METQHDKDQNNEQAGIENPAETDRLAEYPNNTDIVREYPDRIPSEQPDQLNVARTIEEAADDDLSDV